MTSPVDLVLYCPRCGEQHIDKPEPEHGWTNPPHRSHLCATCECIWRPADVPTNGIAQVTTEGELDTWPPGEAPSIVQAVLGHACRRCIDCQGEEHHWIEDPRPYGESDYACRHCDARGVTCPECDGDEEDAETCDRCHGAGVVAFVRAPSPSRGVERGR